MSFLKDLSSSKQVTLRHFAIGSFTLDLISEETHQLTISATESAVETGAKISDHRIINPREIMVRGIVVNYDQSEFFGEVFPKSAGLLDNIKLPIQISAVTDRIRNAVNTYGVVAKKLKRAMEMSFMPNRMNDTSATDDRITIIKNTLDRIAITEDYIQVMTSMGLYDNIQISSVSVVRSNMGSAEFSLYLREILTYDVEVVGGIDAQIKTENPKAKSVSEEAKKPAGQNKSERPKQQASQPQNKGRTTPQTTKKSALRTIFDGAGWNR